MQKIKDFFNKKANSKHFIVVGSILMSILLITALIYFKTEDIIYEGISLTSILLLLLLGIVYAIKNFKKVLGYGAYFIIMLMSVLSIQGLLAKQMYKLTNINTEFWLNSISVMLSSLLGAGIAGGISFILVSKQIKYSNEAVEKQIDENKQLTAYTLEQSKKETDNKNKNVALNYIYLLNAEMAIHRNIFIIYIYCKFHSNPVAKDLEDIFKSLNSYKWDKIFIECAKCFSNELMENLCGYYHGVEMFKELEMNDIQKKELLEGQLISMCKCINIAESEFKIKLKVQDICDIEDKKVSLDKTGKLIIKQIKRK